MINKNDLRKAIDSIAISNSKRNTIYKAFSNLNSINKEEFDSIKSDISKVVESMLTKDTVGKANGVASLDSNGSVPIEQLGNIDTTLFLIVRELPTTDIKTNKIYIVPNQDAQGNNIYVEYLYVENVWENLGEFKGTGASTAAAVTFDNAASGMTAVTAQAAIDELSSKISEEITRVDVELTAFEFIDGYYSSHGDIAAYTENDAYSCRLIKVNKGEKYIVKGQGASSARLWFTADDNNNIIRRADASVVDYNGIIITINDGETRLGYNTIKTASIKELRYYGFIQEEFQKKQENKELLKVTSKVNKFGYFDTSYSNTAAIWQWFNISIKKGELYTISVTSNNNWSRLIIAINSSNQKRCYDNSTSENSYTGTFLANEDIESIGIYAAVGTRNLVSLSVDKELSENFIRNEIGLNGIKFPATEMNRARQDMAAFCFVFDDGDAKDDDVVTLFDQFNIKCGFALIGQDSFVNPNGRGSRYLFYQNKGYSCLNHNSSAADLESYTTEAEAAAAISSAKNLLDNLGIVTNGWVCPNNKWVSNFRNLLGSFHAYAFGDHGYGEGTQVYDVNTRTQDILRLHRYDIQDISTLQAIKNTIDLACQNGYMVCFYGHAARIGMEGYYTMAMIQEIIEYLIVKRNAGQCFLSSPDEVVKYYFNL